MFSIPQSLNTIIPKFQSSIILLTVLQDELDVNKVLPEVGYTRKTNSNIINNDLKRITKRHKARGIW